MEYHSASAYLCENGIFGLGARFRYIQTNKKGDILAKCQIDKTYLISDHHLFNRL